MGAQWLLGLGIQPANGGMSRRLLTERRESMKHTPKPGAYRELFKSGLLALLRTGDLSEQERKDAVHYLLLLDNPNYKFGSLQPTNGYTDFFRS